MSLNTISYKFCTLGTAVTKVGDKILHAMELRNPWVWGDVHCQLYYCSCATNPSLNHTPPIKPIMSVFNLTDTESMMPDVAGNRIHTNNQALLKFSEFVEENGISKESTFYNCVMEWWQTMTYGLGEDCLIHHLFAIPQISTKTVLRQKNGEIRAWKTCNGVPVVGRLVTRNFMEAWEEYSPPQVNIIVCYEVATICAATLVNFFIPRRSFLGSRNGILEEVYPYSESYIKDCRYKCITLATSQQFGNPWIVDYIDEDATIAGSVKSPLFLGTDFNRNGEAIHPHPYVPVGDITTYGSSSCYILPHFGSPDDYNCGARKEFGSEFYFYCYLLNVIMPIEARTFVYTLTNDMGIADEMFHGASTGGNTKRVGLYRDSTGSVVYINASVFGSQCAYCKSASYSDARVGTPPDYHEFYGQNVVIGTEEGDVIHNQYGQCIAPGLKEFVDPDDYEPVQLEYNEFITNFRLRINVTVKVSGNASVFLPTSAYTAKLCYCITGIPDDIYLYDSSKTQIKKIGLTGGEVDVTDIVAAGGGEVSYYIGAGTPLLGNGDVLNLAGSQVMLTPNANNSMILDNSIDIDDYQVRLPDAKFYGDF